jgi:hypothetical protein
MRSIRLGRPKSPFATRFHEPASALAKIASGVAATRGLFMRSPQPKSASKPDDRRRSRRRPVNRTAKILAGTGALPRECLVTDISDGGVRLHVEGFSVPEDFVLLLAGEEIAKSERAYRVVWRLGQEIGAKFVGFIRRPRAVP